MYTGRWAHRQIGDWPLPTEVEAAPQNGAMGRLRREGLDCVVQPLARIRVDVARQELLKDVVVGDEHDGVLLRELHLRARGTHPGERPRWRSVQHPPLSAAATAADRRSMHVPRIRAHLRDQLIDTAMVLLVRLGVGAPPLRVNFRRVE